MDGVKSAAVGARMMEDDGAQPPTQQVYQAALQECAEGMGVSLEQAQQILTRPRFNRQHTANYMFTKLEAYVKNYLTKEN